MVSQELIGDANSEVGSLVWAGMLWHRKRETRGKEKRGELKVIR
jgi:hypothetical protein